MTNTSYFVSFLFTLFLLSSSSLVIAASSPLSNPSSTNCNQTSLPCLTWMKYRLPNTTTTTDSSQLYSDRYYYARVSSDGNHKIAVVSRGMQHDVTWQNTNPNYATLLTWHVASRKLYKTVPKGQNSTSFTFSDFTIDASVDQDLASMSATERNTVFLGNASSQTSVISIGQPDDPKYQASGSNNTTTTAAAARGIETDYTSEFYVNDAWAASEMQSQLTERKIREDARKRDLHWKLGVGVGVGVGVPILMTIMFGIGWIKGEYAMKRRMMRPF